MVYVGDETLRVGKFPEDSHKITCSTITAANPMRAPGVASVPAPKQAPDWNGHKGWERRSSGSPMCSQQRFGLLLSIPAPWRQAVATDPPSISTARPLLLGGLQVNQVCHSNSAVGAWCLGAVWYLWGKYESISLEGTLILRS